jgi:hypothetical protein
MTLNDRWTTSVAFRHRGAHTCSVCLRVELRGIWLEAEDAIQRLRTYETAVPPRLRHGLCPHCEEAIAYRRVA